MGEGDRRTDEGTTKSLGIEFGVHPADFLNRISQAQGRPRSVKGGTREVADPASLIRKTRALRRPIPRLAPDAPAL